MSIENQEYFLNQWRIQKSMKLSVNAGEWKYGMKKKSFAKNLSLTDMSFGVTLIQSLDENISCQGVDEGRLRAISLFSYSVGRNPRETKMTRRVAESASSLAFCHSTLTRACTPVISLRWGQLLKLLNTDCYSNIKREFHAMFLLKVKLRILSLEFYGQIFVDTLNPL